MDSPVRLAEHFIIRVTAEVLIRTQKEVDEVSMFVRMPTLGHWQAQEGEEDLIITNSAFHAICCTFTSFIHFRCDWRVLYCSCLNWEFIVLTVTL